MALVDDAVITPGLGYVFVAPVGTASPTPSELDELDAATFGSKVINLKWTGSPTSGKLTVSAESTGVLPAASTAAVVQAALEALSTVGVGNVTVTGVSLVDASGLEVTFIGALQGKSITITADTFVGGTSPALTTTVVTALNGWINVGHTSRDDMPEFGFDGGDTEVKGTWQNSKLREVTTETPADFLTLFLHQFDNQSMELYYGENASVVSGEFGVSGDVSEANEKSLLIIIVDGGVNLGFFARKASVRRDDSISLPVDDFASLPIKATFLKDGANLLYKWISVDLFD